MNANARKFLHLRDRIAFEICKVVVNLSDELGGDGLRIAVY